MITLQLSVADVNTILSKLGQQPFSEVNELITRILSQAVPQAKTQEAEA